MITTPNIRIDDFNLIIRDRYYVKVDLIVNEDSKCIEFSILYIDSQGLNTKLTKEVKVIPEEPALLMIWINLLKAIFKKDSDVSEEVRNSIEDGSAPVDEIDYPNEYTMWHNSWYKHNYTFLQPFYSHQGALLRLSYLISELVDENIITENMIECLPEVKKYPVKL